MKDYIKKHTSHKAALAHKEKIEKRGGIAALVHEHGKYVLTYHFPDKKNEGKKKSVKQPQNQYDILSPDGKTIRKPGVPPFTSIQKSREYFEEWKRQFARQGYWSPSKGLIPLPNLANACKWISLNKPNDK